MAYKLLYAEKAVKFLEKLEKGEALRIYNKIEGIKDNPLHYIQRLVGVNLWKFRIGDYRAIMMLDRAKQEITVIDVGHRKDIYKSL